MAVEKILVIDDEHFIRKTFEEVLRGKRYGVSSAGSLAEAERLMKREQFDVAFVDVRLPDGEGTTFLERVATTKTPPLSSMRAGAFDYLLKPFSISQIEVLVRKAEGYRQMVKVNEYLSAELAGAKELVGGSDAMNRLREMLRKVAPTEATVLIQGENGTGKELVAQAIYQASGRASAPYIRVNCAALSENLMESEFFGHEKGSFTGATERREGRFELADGGTLLLDEISEISPRLQAKLLRVLQEREFERVGGTKTIQVDVRVLATTNRDLRKSVEKGDFREDLYYRLNVFPVSVPPLRERTGDIRVLASHFLNRFARQHGRSEMELSPSCLNVLEEHRWPGNVRELQNTIERAVIMSELGAPIIPASLAIGDPPAGWSAAKGGKGSSKGADTLQREDVVVTPVPAAAPDAGGQESALRPLAEVEKLHILGVLESCSGNRTRAADTLGISIRTLRNKLHEYRASGLAASAESVGVELE